MNTLPPFANAAPTAACTTGNPLPLPHFPPPAFAPPPQIKEFKDAIEDDYFFEMFIDDLPMWGYLGEVVHEEFLLGKSIQGARVMLYPHLHFSIGFNNDQIVTANVTTDTKRGVDITDATQGQEVSWGR